VASYGMTIGGGFDLVGPFATACEAKGFDAVWVAETDHTAIVQAAVAIQATERIRVGTNIALAFPTAPAAQAMLAWDLAELSGDRFTLGLGSQVQRIVEDRFGVDFRPAAKRMREYVQAMRAAWAMHRGEDDAAFVGDLYHVRHPGVTGGGAGRGQDLTVPVYVAAVGPLMIRGACAVADGILGHPFTSDRYIRDTVLPRIDEGLEESGRDRDEFTLAQGLMVATSEDGHRAREWCKQQIAFYGTTPNYRGVFESYGDEHLLDDLRRAFRADRKDVEALRAAVPDEAVDRYAVAGTPDEVRDRLREFEGLADHVVIGGPWYRMRTEDLFESAGLTMDVVASLTTAE
jgi:probable F420-dependent oxidoreductase